MSNDVILYVYGIVGLYLTIRNGIEMPFVAYNAKQNKKPMHEAINAHTKNLILVVVWPLTAFFLAVDFLTKRVA